MTCTLWDFSFFDVWIQLSSVHFATYRSSNEAAIPVATATDSILGSLCLRFATVLVTGMGASQSLCVATTLGLWIFLTTP